MTTSSPPKTGPLSRLLTTLAPTWPAATLTLIGFTVEAILVTNTPNNPLSAMGGLVTLLALLLMITQWVLLGWLFWLVSALAKRFEGTSPLRRNVTRIAAIVFCTTLIGTYSASWLYYSRSGLFLDVETIRFALLNTSMMAPYLSKGDTSLFSIFAFSLLLLTVLVTLILRWSARLTFTRPRPLCLIFLCATIGYTALLVSAWTLIPPSSGLRRGFQSRMLRESLNPTATFFLSLWETVGARPIEPILDTEELIPLEEGNHWTVPPLPRHDRHPSIIFVAVESLRHDVVHQIHQHLPVMPNLNRIASRGLQFTRAYSQSTHSDYSDVCIVSSLYPLRTRMHHYYRKDDPWPKTLIYDLLKEAGYSAAIISSQNEAWGAMDQFLDTDSLDFFYDAERSDAGASTSPLDGGVWAEVQQGMLRAGILEDQHTMDTAIEWIGQQVEDERPFFLSMNFQSSHFPYVLPPGAERPFSPYEFDFDVSFLQYPPEKTEVVRNAYFNSLRECDRQIGRLIAALDRLDRLDDTVLAIIGENGEAFHYKGVVSHAGLMVEPTIHVACVLHCPSLVEPGVDDYPMELIDLVPTVLGLMGWHPHPNFQGIDVVSTDRPPAEERLLFFHVQNSIASADALLLGGRWKYYHNWRQGTRNLYDLAQDPREAEDLLDQRPELASRLASILNQWRDRQLAYYWFPFYYEAYYPPLPPRSKGLPAHQLDPD